MCVYIYIHIYIYIYIYIYIQLPSANPPPRPGLLGQALKKNSSKNNKRYKPSKPTTKFNKHPKKKSKIHPKSIKNRPKICPQGPLGGLLEALGQLLEGSWGPLGGLLGLSWPILAPRSNISSKSAFEYPLDPPMLGPQIQQNPTYINIKIDKKNNDFLK